MSEDNVKVDVNIEADKEVSKMSPNVAIGREATTGMSNPSETSLLVKVYTKLGYKRLGDFIYQTVLFCFALVLILYLVLGLPAEAMKYELFRVQVEQMLNCTNAGHMATAHCSDTLAPSLFP